QEPLSALVREQAQAGLALAGAGVPDKEHPLAVPNRLRRMRFRDGWALVLFVLAPLDLSGVDVVDLAPELVAAALVAELRRPYRHDVVDERTDFLERGHEGRRRPRDCIASRSAPTCARSTPALKSRTAWSSLRTASSSVSRRCSSSCRRRSITSARLAVM